jgi:hypothetical protein
MTNANALPEFDQFFLQDTARLELEMPNGDPMLFNGQPVAVNLHGPSVPKFVAALDKKQREATKRVFAAMGQKNKRTKDDAATEADIEFLCAVTEGFENFPFPGGAAAIYRDARLKYINSQVEGHLGDMGNFFKKSTTN